MGAKMISFLVLLMVCTLILLPKISGQNAQCYSGLECKDSSTCIDLCKANNHELGGTCFLRVSRCCCYIKTLPNPRIPIMDSFITN
ncbi:hypothetical protein CARUB_v10006616mg [Capsella rubella]|uniref:Knottin scorpion toxin-like domain-containing protein n=1 Tax=Capsella rubella TaxID=81985 RepID=R0H0L6_9BRAS|nr:hypothetical protein CARUB_v10006616mg [Capsella rubella]